jgi:hypothetical protein
VDLASVWDGGRRRTLQHEVVAGAMTLEDRGLRKQAAVLRTALDA